MNYKTKIRDLTVFAFLGILLFVGKIIFEPLPNIHPLAALVMVYTLVYRERALIPIYLYIFLQGLISGFDLWWMPYLYIWTLLWGATMLLPKNLSKKRAAVIYPAVCALHGFLYGALYAPAQAILFKFSFETTVKWIILGLPYDALHAAGNFAAGFLVLPLATVLKRLSEK